MTVALSILLAALVGGVVFMLLDGWQRKRVEPAGSASRSEPELPLWKPEPESYSSWQRPSAETAPLPSWQRPSAEHAPRPWPPEEDTRPLAPEPPRREPPPLWTPPTSSRHRWDEDDRYRDEDDDNRPPGLWSGWADRR